MKSAEAAIASLVDLLRGRKEDDGFAWFCKADSKAVMDEHELDRFAMSGVWRQVKKKMGRIERFTGHLRIRETVGLIKILRARGVREIDDAVRAEFGAAFPGVQLTGPLTGAALRRVSRRGGRRSPRRNGHGTDVGRAEGVLAEHAMLTARAVSLKAEAREVDAKLKRLRTLLNPARAFVKALHRINSTETK